MFELASALFSIADANEFRFARFYIVCEVVPLGAPESSLIVCGLSDTSSRSVKTWPRHGRNWQKRQRRNSRILFQRISYALFLSGTLLHPTFYCDRQSILRPVCEPHFALLLKSLRFGKLTNAQVMIKLTLACKKYVKKA